MLVNIKAIQIAPNRQRREFDPAALQELGDSIQKFGLFHPIVLREHQDGFWLVAGERRLRAISDLYALGSQFSHDGKAVPLDFIPAVSLGDLDEIAREEAELEENTQRIDLSWQERAQAVARLSALRDRQAVAAGEPSPSVASIALETKGNTEGAHYETTRRELLLAKHLDSPEVKSAKSLNDAWKVLKRKETEEKNARLGAEVGAAYRADTAHTLLNEDSLNWMQLAEPEQFDVILTDPIYGIGADEFGDSGGHTAGAHFYEDSYDTWRLHVKVLAHEGYRICKPAAHLYAFCDITHFKEFKDILRDAGWQPFRTPIIWHKPNGNRVPWVESGPQRKWEMVVYAKKGNRPVTRIYPDLISYAADENLGHNAQKPVALFLDILKRSVQPGNAILDPFAGSCPILPAANELKCRATAIEIDQAAYGIGVKRLRDLSAQPELEGL